MSQDQEMEKVKGRIRALLSKTTVNGCSEEEALSAASKVGELLDLYNLSLTDVIISKAECLKMEFVLNKKHTVDNTLLAIADFCDCICWGSGFKKNHYYFFGFGPDVESAIWLAKYFYMTMIMAEVEFKASDVYLNSNTHRKALTTDFLRGMAKSLRDKLNIMKEERTDSFISSSLEGSNIDRSLILKSKSDKIQSEFKKIGIKLSSRTTYSRATKNSDAYNSGYAAGQKVNINKTVSSGKSPLSLK
jgi:hypothetical protein